MITRIKKWWKEFNAPPPHLQESSEYKKTCGYLDKNGIFHKNLNSYLEANHKMDLDNIKQQFINCVFNELFHIRVSTGSFYIDEYMDNVLKGVSNLSLESKFRLSQAACVYLCKERKLKKKYEIITT